MPCGCGALLLVCQQTNVLVFSDRGDESDRVLRVSQSAGAVWGRRTSCEGLGTGGHPSVQESNRTGKLILYSLNVSQDDSCGITNRGCCLNNISF